MDVVTTFFGMSLDHSPLNIGYLDQKLNFILLVYKLAKIVDQLFERSLGGLVNKLTLLVKHTFNARNQQCSFSIKLGHGGFHDQLYFLMAASPIAEAVISSVGFPENIVLEIHDGIF